MEFWGNKYLGSIWKESFFVILIYNILKVRPPKKPIKTDSSAEKKNVKDLKTNKKIAYQTFDKQPIYAAKETH